MNALMETYIEFPKLGLEFHIERAAFKLAGGISIYWYGLIICFGLLLTTIIAMKVSKKYGIDSDDILDYLIFALPSAIIGARLYYCIFHWSDTYSENPITIITNIKDGGLAIYGGIIGALIATFFVSKFKKRSFLKIVDFAMPHIILGQAIGRWGNFVNQEAYGGFTKLPWGMSGNTIAEDVGSQSLVHPTFLYESLICFAAFAFMIIYRRKYQKQTGEVLALYLIIYGVARAFIEGLRTDSLYIGSTNIRVSQLLSVCMVIVGVAFLIDLKKKISKKKKDNTKEEKSQLSDVVERLKKLENESTDKVEMANLSAEQDDEFIPYDSKQKDNENNSDK